MLEIDLNDKDFHVITFCETQEKDRLTLNSSKQLFKVIYSILSSKKNCVIRNHRNVEIRVYPSKHFYFDDEIIFLNLSLKNKFKNIAIKSDIKNFINLQTYLKELL
ncbi:hypothetical protein [Bacteriovorax sp. Seq25_V]|uniref:hypothetical protein n=1 Tax=Bacteriovorax sp. Seq25_V TaxID=1201288 RepID=UPI000389F7FC|nr:hypothetical protein [Bacteriovorax sp. Seq25_V]EQC43325.1 hypothetical protein M900_0155 [Bacteriovorax sp. Seq25_V]